MFQPLRQNAKYPPQVEVPPARNNGCRNAKEILCNTQVLSQLISGVATLALLSVALAFAVANLKATQAVCAKVIIGCLAPIVAINALNYLGTLSIIGCAAFCPPK
jgi:hypothetical protein